MKRTKYQQFLDDVLFGVQGYDKEIKLARSAEKLVDALQTCLNCTEMNLDEVDETTDEAIKLAVKTLKEAGEL